MDCQTGKGKTIRKLVKLEVGVETRGVGTWEDFRGVRRTVRNRGRVATYQPRRRGRVDGNSGDAGSERIQCTWGNKNGNKGPASGTTKYRRTRDVAVGRGAESKQNGQYACTRIYSG